MQFKTSVLTFFVALCSTQLSSAAPSLEAGLKKLTRRAVPSSAEQGGAVPLPAVHCRMRAESRRAILPQCCGQLSLAGAPRLDDRNLPAADRAVSRVERAFSGSRTDPSSRLNQLSSWCNKDGRGIEACARKVPKRLSRAE
ncbi:hypothetical protein BKA70DRAFT_1412803 [Coprinopsis sp. MPI-PUGE-AT-0042]|nr:hypothetical protein BKA70DRAFT_1412803 [Coprinopsis sp. MPI-PUGE-AT-0042]